MTLGSEGGPPKGSSLALGPEDRKALPQLGPGNPLPHPVARNQEVRTEGLSLDDSSPWTLAVLREKPFVDVLFIHFTCICSSIICF